MSHPFDEFMNFSARRRDWFNDPAWWDAADQRLQAATKRMSERAHDHKTRDTYNDQVETGAEINGQRETISFGDQVGE